MDLDATTDRKGIAIRTEEVYAVIENREIRSSSSGGAEAQSLHWRWHKRDDIYPYEAEQRNGIETWYGRETRSSLCRTRIDTVQRGVVTKSVK